ncbi:MAG TPA: hypothetical protein DCL61_26490, partial [Cyanobacteria bacterium UBA12227]|nr:hypothetical protein [Cyanobacteria bacterium UBA12227]
LILTFGGLAIAATPITAATLAPTESASRFDVRFLQETTGHHMMAVEIGVGDQVGYPDTFQDAMGILEEKISELGGQTVGYWPTNGYEFNESKAIRDGNFVGLALDEDNQSDLTEERIEAWVAQLKSEFSL